MTGIGPPRRLVVALATLPTAGLIVFYAWPFLTLVLSAVDGGHVTVARMLLDRGADANAARSTGVTPLMIAAARGNRTLVQMLLDAGANVQAQDRSGTTALSAAVDGGHEDIVELLLKR